MRIPRAVFAIGISVAFTACGGADRNPDYSEASDVYEALVSRLDEQEKVLHATVRLTQSDSPYETTLELWIDEGRDIAREDRGHVGAPDQTVIVADGQRHVYLGDNDPVSWEAPNCEGVTAPATALLLRCEGVDGSRSELVEADEGRLIIETTGFYDDGNPWTIAVTFDEESLMPLLLESDLQAALNGEPYEVHETWTYTTELVERASLPDGLFEFGMSRR